jgi:hypothetical protein
VTAFRLSPPPVFPGVESFRAVVVPADHPEARWPMPNPWGTWVAFVPCIRWLGWDQSAALAASVREVLA